MSSSTTLYLILIDFLNAYQKFFFLTCVNDRLVFKEVLADTTTKSLLTVPNTAHLKTELGAFTHVCILLVLFKVP